MKLNKEQKDKPQGYLDSRLSILNGIAAFDPSVSESADKLRTQLEEAKEKITNASEEAE